VVVTEKEIIMEIQVVLVVEVLLMDLTQLDQVMILLQVLLKEILVELVGLLIQIPVELVVEQRLQVELIIPDLVLLDLV